MLSVVPVSDSLEFRFIQPHYGFVRSTRFAPIGQPIFQISWVAQLLPFSFYAGSPRVLGSNCLPQAGPATSSGCIEASQLCLEVEAN
jgi:hypothetical protein